MSEKDDLEKFRQQWKAEVKQKADPAKKPGSSAVPKPIPLEKRPTFEPFNIAERLLEGQTGKDSLVNTEGLHSDAAKELFDLPPKRLRLETEDKEKFRQMSKPSSFLDIFLNDLIEITEIPFFDLELPRELAMKIFEHLDAVDLCRCAQVSKAWRDLAEDEYLWTRIAHSLGYDENTQTTEKQQWKEQVKQHIQQERQLQANWKSRLGEFRQLQYVQGGVLCAAASTDTVVVAGYNNGSIKLWEVESLDYECTFQPSESALVLDEGAEAGTVANLPCRLSVQDNFVVAVYTQGSVDVWSSARGSTAVVPSASYHLGRPTAGAAKQHLTTTPGAIVTAYDKTVRLDTLRPETATLHSSNVLTMEAQVTDLKTLAADSVSSPPLHIIVAMGDKLKVLHCKDDHSGGGGGCTVTTEQMTTLHHGLYQSIRCMDACMEGSGSGGGGQVAAGIMELGAAQCKIKLFSLPVGREEGEFTAGACGPCCINLADSPPNCFVTGSNDRKVRVYDVRMGRGAVLSLLGHTAPVLCVTMDDWKVVSGAGDGLVAVWDKRMGTKLWELHNRHPVQYLRATPTRLLTANIPYNLQPEMDTFDNMTHRRNRGALHMYDFTVVQTGRKDAPEIIQSTFDEPERYNYNVRLAMPYDNL